jgi:hypothetical protein
MSMKKTQLFVTALLGLMLLLPMSSMAKVTSPYLLPAQVTEVSVSNNNFTYKYPQVQGLPEASAQKFINEDIQKHINNFILPMQKVNEFGAKHSDVITGKVQANITYTIPCNTDGIFSVIINESANVMHKNGKVNSYNAKNCFNYAKDGTVITAEGIAPAYKYLGEADPFSKASLKASVQAAAKAQGFTLLPEFEQNLSDAANNFYFDSDTNIHALYAPGTIAPENKGYIDVPLTK